MTAGAGTAERLIAELRYRHRRVLNRSDGRATCYLDGEPWPCKVAQLADVAEAQGQYSGVGAFAIGATAPLPGAEFHTLAEAWAIQFAAISADVWTPPDVAAVLRHQFYVGAAAVFALLFGDVQERMTMGERARRLETVDAELEEYAVAQEAARGEGT